MHRLKTSGRRQRGLSSVGWIAVAGLFGLIVFSVLTVFPMYYDHFKVKSVMKAIQQDQRVDVKSKRAITNALLKRFYIQEVRSITRDDIAISRKNGKTTVNVSYEVRASYILNLSIIGAFSESAVINR